MKNIRDTKIDLKRSKHRKTGIEPNELTNNDVEYYFDLVHEDNFAFDEASIYDYLIINHQGFFYRLLKIIYVSCCIFSSYMYGFFTLYDNPMD